jgi:hypothetical protein
VILGWMLTYVALALALVLLLGSCDYKTRRHFESTAKHAEDFDADELDRWAALTSLFSIVAVALLGNMLATIATRHGGPPGSLSKPIVLTTVALALFALGASTAWRHWIGVIAEQQRANYEVQIAFGLPAVTYSGALGAAACALHIIVLLSAARMQNKSR